MVEIVNGYSSLREIQKQIGEDSNAFFPELADDLVHHVLGLCGEAGEVANLFKKVQRGDLSFEEEDTISMFLDELADVLIYTLSIAEVIGVDLGECYRVKREYNQSRFNPEFQ